MSKHVVAGSSPVTSSSAEPAPHSTGALVFTRSLCIKLLVCFRSRQQYLNRNTHKRWATAGFHVDSRVGSLSFYKRLTLFSHTARTSICNMYTLENLIITNDLTRALGCDIMQVKSNGAFHFGNAPFCYLRWYNGWTTTISKQIRKSQKTQYYTLNLSGNLSLL